MRILTVFGTRPEIIRLSFVMQAIDPHCEQTLVHTGQNFHASLSDVFFTELGLRVPDRNLEIRGDSFGEQAGQLFAKMETVFDEVAPDRVLILGDTNSALSALIAARRRIPVFHMEAGNRCFDDRVPEEVNRRIIDHASTILLPYTERSKENLVREGIERDRIYITGNPIYEVLTKFAPSIDSSNVLSDLNLTPKDYFLATIHRAENVDVKEPLEDIFAAFDRISREFNKQVLISVHPRTAAKLQTFNIAVEPTRVRLLDALPFFSFVKLEQNAFMVLSDSGTVQEECAIFGIPNVTVRNVTERPETVECGSNIIGGTSVDTILRGVRLAASNRSAWVPPSEYLTNEVSQTVANILLGNLSRREHH